MRKILKRMLRILAAADFHPVNRPWEEEEEPDTEKSSHSFRFPQKSFVQLTQSLGAETGNKCSFFQESG